MIYIITCTNRKEVNTMKIISYSKCVKCGRIIAKTEQIETDEGFEYFTINAECRYINKHGNSTNYCKTCIKRR